MDVGGSKMLGIVLDPDGTIVAEQRVSTPATPAEVVGALTSVYRRLAGDARLAVGVGAPGTVDRGGVLHRAPNLPAADGLALAELLGAELGVDVVVDNDATCAAVGEASYGTARGVGEVLLVTMGTGIGGAVIAGGDPQRGANGFAGEIGHMVIDPGGPPCVCGGRGCWERFASGQGLRELAQREAAQGRLGTVLASVGGDATAIRAEDVTAAAASGEAESLSVLAEFARFTALGVWNLVLVLDPELVVLGGGIGVAWPALADAVSARLETLAAPWAGGRPAPPVVTAALGACSGAVGAAVLARRGDTCASP
ncbi:MAG: ROK family protein [Acidimicrobiales bacterium]